MCVGFLDLQFRFLVSHNTDTPIYVSTQCHRVCFRTEVYMSSRISVQTLWRFEDYLQSLCHVVVHAVRNLFQNHTKIMGVSWSFPMNFFVWSTVLCSVLGIPIDKNCYQLSIRILIDKTFSRVLVIIQLLIRQPSYQPTIDNETWVINSWYQIRFGTWQMKSTSPSQSDRKGFPWIFPIRTTVYIGRG